MRRVIAALAVAVILFAALLFFTTGCATWELSEVSATYGEQNTRDEFGGSHGPYGDITLTWTRKRFVEEESHEQ